MIDCNCGLIVGHSVLAQPTTVISIKQDLYLFDNGSVTYLKNFISFVCEMIHIGILFSIYHM